MGRSAAICIGLLAATWFVFGQTRSFDFVTYDDPDYVTENRDLSAGLSREGIRYALTTPVMGFYHPVTMLSLLADYELFGLEPRGYHLVNVGLHALSSLLLFAFLQYCTGRTWPSAAVAALFAVHPLHVESVAWIAERKDVLSTFFGLACLWAYAGFARTGSRRLYGLSLMLLTIGLLSKSMLVTLPVLMLLLDRWPLDRLELPSARAPLAEWWEALRPRLWEKAPFFAAALIAAGLTLWIQRMMGAMGEQAIREGTLGIAAADLPNVPYSYARYVAMNLWPSDLAVLYPHPTKPHAGGVPLAGWQVAESLVFLGLVTWGAVRLRRPYALTGWLWFLISLVPVSGIIQIGSLGAADRYTYLPSIGLFWLVCFALADAVEGLAKRSGAARPVAATLAVVVIAGYAFVAHTATSVWQNSITLYEQGIRVNPRNTMMHYNLGNYLRKRGRTDEAMKHFSTVTSLDPGHFKAHINLGEAHAAKGDHETAVEEYRFALRIRPDNVIANNNLANSLKELGRDEEALFHYKKSVESNDGNSLPHYNLGNFYLKRDRFEEAIEQYRSALKLNPRYTSAMGNLGNALLRLGRYEEAAQVYRRALAIDPDNAVSKSGLKITENARVEPESGADGEP
jgi:tetratricopeptide (TPR) repeat protein